jgi:hypothetical protein
LSLNMAPFNQCFGKNKQKLITMPGIALSFDFGTL